jgi:hypothetical protein
VRRRAKLHILSLSVRLTAICLFGTLLIKPRISRNPFVDLAPNSLLAFLFRKFLPPNEKIFIGENWFFFLPDFAEL